MGVTILIYMSLNNELYILPVVCHCGIHALVLYQILLETAHHGVSIVFLPPYNTSQLVLSNERALCLMWCTTGAG